MLSEDDLIRVHNIIKKCDDCKFATCEQYEINWTDIQSIKKLYDFCIDNIK